jgi:hypothetical protein
VCSSHEGRYRLCFEVYLFACKNVTELKCQGYASIPSYFVFRHDVVYTAETTGQCDVHDLTAAHWLLCMFLPMAQQSLVGQGILTIEAS